MKKLLILLTGVAGFSGGLSAQWTNVNTGSERFLNRVYFPTATVGYIIPFDGPMLRSTNGGASWDSLSTLSFAAANLENRMYFVSDSIGFVSTHVGNFARVYKTTNMGNSWTDISPANNLYGIMHIQFISAQKGYLYSNNNFDDKFWVTENGGSSWTEKTLGFTLGTGSASLPKMFFVNDSTGYLAGGDGTFAYRAVIMKTSNSGSSWHADSLGVNTVGHLLHFPNADTGFLVSNMGGIFRTVNAGASWDTISSFSSNYWVSDIHFINGMTGYLTQEGNIYKSTDGGFTWNSVKQGSRFLADIFFRNGTGYAVGDSGTLLTLGNAAGLKKMNNTDMAVYPNPSNGKFRILVPAQLSGQDLQLHIRNSLGVVVSTLAVSDEIISDLPSGIYFYSLTKKEGTLLGQGKLIVSRE